MCRFALALWVVLAVPLGLSAQLSELEQLRLNEVVRQHQVVMIRTSRLQDGYLALREPRLSGDDLEGEIQNGTAFGEATYETASYPLDQVLEIRVRDGRRHWEGLGYGAAVGLVFASALHVQCQRDFSCTEPSIGYPAFYGLAISTWGLLGLGAGAFAPKWSPIYTRRIPLEIIASAAPRAGYPGSRSRRSAVISIGLRATVGGVTSR